MEEDLLNALKTKFDTCQLCNCERKIENSERRFLVFLFAYIRDENTHYEYILKIFIKSNIEVRRVVILFTDAPTCVCNFSNITFIRRTNNNITSK